MLNEKIKDIINNEEFIAKMEKTEAEDMKSLFAEYGVELTDEEVLEFVKEAVEEEHGDIPLNEDDLENVAGGVAVGLALKALGWTWKFAVRTYGSPEAAARGIISYWSKKFRGR